MLLRTNLRDKRKELRHSLLALCKMEESNGAGLKHQLSDVKIEQQQQQQQQQQQPVSKRRHVVNVADAAITEGGSSSAPVEGIAP